MRQKLTEKKYTSFNFRVENTTLKQLTELAEKEDRTVASLIRIIINEYLKKSLTNKKNII